MGRAARKGVPADVTVKAVLLAMELAAPGPSFTDAVFEAALACVGEGEATRILSYGRRRDRERSLAGALLSRLALADALTQEDQGNSCTPAPWEFCILRGPTGRPRLGAGRHPCADFNLSHAGAWVVCLAARESRVGVDVERVRPVEPALLRRCLMPDEYERVIALPPRERLAEFFQAWTAKEARLKGTGVGLATPLDSVPAAPPDGWSLAHLWLDHNHLVAMCAEQPAVPPRRADVVTMAMLLQRLPALRGPG